jgi:hypothetical protein
MAAATTFIRCGHTNPVSHFSLVLSLQGRVKNTTWDRSCLELSEENNRGYLKWPFPRATPLVSARFLFDIFSFSRDRVLQHAAFFGISKESAAGFTA